MSGLTSGELAKQGGINLESIRFYEKQGLLPRAPRTRSGYRLFALDDVRRVRFIKRAQDLGFSLREIKELLALRLDRNTSCAGVRTVMSLSGRSHRYPRSVSTSCPCWKKVRLRLSRWWCTPQWDALRIAVAERPSSPARR